LHSAARLEIELLKNEEQEEQHSSIHYSKRFLYFDLQIQIAQRSAQVHVISMEDGRNYKNVASILTADEFLKIGLKLVGYKGRRIRRCKKTNIKLDRIVARDLQKKNALLIKDY
jgi:hypothetical protein